MTIRPSEIYAEFLFTRIPQRPKRPSAKFLAIRALINEKGKHSIIRLYCHTGEWTTTRILNYASDGAFVVYGSDSHRGDL